MIKRIFIDGYKCYRKFEMLFDGKPFSFLAGRNGAGKTTLFEVLALVRDIACRGRPLVDEMTGRFLVMGDTLTRWAKDVKEQQFELNVTLEGGAYKYLLVVDVPKNATAPRVKKEMLFHTEKPIYTFNEGNVTLFNDKYQSKAEFHADWSKSFLPSIAERQENRKLTKFKNWLRGLLYIRPNPMSMTSVAKGESKSPDRELSNFAAWLRYLKQSADDESYTAYLNDIKECIPGLSGVKLEDVGDGVKELNLTISGSKFKFSEISDGQKMLMALYAIVHFASRQTALVCIDEPDNYLAISEILPLISALQEMSEEDGCAHLLIASHHPEFYRQLAMEEGFVLRRKGNEGVCVMRIADLLNEKSLHMPISDIFARGWEV